MNVTATLFGQIITFAVLVWFIMRFLWKPLTNLMEERQKRIADGLADAEKGKHELELAEKRAIDVIRKARAQANESLAQAEKRAAKISEEAKAQASAEAARIISSAKAEITQEMGRAKGQLRKSLAGLAAGGAAKILEKEIDAKTHAALLDKFIKQL